MRSGGAGDRGQPDNKGVGQTKRAEVQKEGGGQLKAGKVDEGSRKRRQMRRGQGREVGEGRDRDKSEGGRRR